MITFAYGSTRAQPPAARDGRPASTPDRPNRAAPLPQYPAAAGAQIGGYRTSSTTQCELRRVTGRMVAPRRRSPIPRGQKACRSRARLHTYQFGAPVARVSSDWQFLDVSVGGHMWGFARTGAGERRATPGGDGHQPRRGRQARQTITRPITWGDSRTGRTRAEGRLPHDHIWRSKQGAMN